MSIPMVLDYLAVRLNGPRAAEKAYEFDVAFTDTDTRYLLEVTNGVLVYTEGASSADATASLTLTRRAIDAIVLGESDFDALIADGSIHLDGDADAFADFVSLLDTFEFWFDIVTP